MTCRDVAETSLSDLAGLAQYCSSRARLQLLKQHSSTIPRFWERRLFDLLVGRPAGIQIKIRSLWMTGREALRWSHVRQNWWSSPKNALTSLQTCVQTQFFVHAVKVSGDQCCFGPHWLLLHGQKQFFKIYYFIFQKVIQVWKDIRGSKCWQDYTMLIELY